jgi:LEA14-like dessication related protein
MEPECEVTSWELRVVKDPKEEVVPYSIWLSEGSFVNHVTVTLVDVMVPVETELMTGGVRSLKVAPIVVFEFTVTVQVDDVPEHAPDQPENVEPEAGEAVRVTVVPEVTEIRQAVPQEMPSGELVTVPEPVPVLATERE